MSALRPGPCPFCKYTGVDVRPSVRTVVFVECMRCGATGPEVYTYNEAVLMWNKAALPKETK